MEFLVRRANLLRTPKAGIIVARAKEATSGSS